MMKVIKEISINRFIAQVLFLLLPTFFVIGFLIWNSSQYFTLLRSQWFSQAIYVSSGALLSYFIFQFRWRFLPLTTSLLVALYAIYKTLDNYAIGEFDSFFITTSFIVFACLFTVGWLIGWALQRISFSPLIISATLFFTAIILISKTGEITIEKLLSYFTPIVLYTIYLVYTYELFRNTEKINAAFWWRFGRRFTLFMLLMSLVLGSVIYMMYDQMVAQIADYGGNAKEGENQMLQTEKDQTVKNRESMSLGSNNNRNKNPEPLFCAHIDSYLEGSDIPNPLYLVSYHFTKFDTLTETFERDTTLPFNDEYLPNPSTIPLFFTQSDSSKLKNAMASKARKTVQIEVYNKRLSGSAFIAPSSSFFIQPIAVEKDFRDEFKSAYKSKSYVSDLNSAYFIYNSPDPMLRAFQEQRFDILRKAKNYDGIDKNFLNYYTFFPTEGKYKAVKLLADSLAVGKKTAIDKVLAVRDYFLAHNELGEQIFQYADNPGIPGLPGASKLLYFLFESKKGYCAYYAAATVFLLRSMGIPSRVVTGFLTVDRSDKNKGWYWYYEDQSHGWVQVYFPEYGWLDFDTTVGNDEAEQSPAPDGTPPMQPPNAIWAAHGEILETDTLKKTARIAIHNLIFKEKEFKNVHINANVDLRIAAIWKDSIRVTLNTLQINDHVMMVSYAEKLKSISVERELNTLLQKLPAFIPVDDVYIQTAKKENKNNEATNEKLNKKSLKYYLRLIAFIALLLFLLIILLPRIVYWWYRIKMKITKRAEKKAYYVYRTILYQLHMMGYHRMNKTVLYFAVNDIDPTLDTHFQNFMHLYLKMKYSSTKLIDHDLVYLTQFYPSFNKKVKEKISFKQRFYNWFHLNRWIDYIVTNFK